MKKFLAIIILLVLGIGAIFVANIVPQDKSKTYLRIHIRANSNLTCDQNIKYKIKDHIVDYLTPLFTDCKSKQQAYEILNNNLENINILTNSVLQQNGFSYSCQAKLNNEYFPTRAYQDVVLESGFYDALILELGQAQGDNWWCVLYPPLCFVENTQNVEYKSKFLEIINSIF